MATSSRSLPAGRHRIRRRSDCRRFDGRGGPRGRDLPLSGNGHSVDGVDRQAKAVCEELRKIDAYWRANLYLCLGMLYLKQNPLLKEPLRGEHTKERLLGHWGSDSGQSFTYTHLNRLINKYDLNAIFESSNGRYRKR
jgi:hypothetical protein